MLIDVHQHIGRLQWPPNDPLTPRILVELMDQWGVARGCVLGLSDTPEGPYLDSSTNEVIAACAEFPDRLIPFCLIDPRFGDNSPDMDFRPLLDEYRDRGCKGIGEFLPNLYTDDPRCVNLYRQCGEVGLPVLFDMNSRIGGIYGIVDEAGLPRLESCLKECPDTIFIGHGIGFWADISGDSGTTDRTVYPTGRPVIAGGGVPRLMEKYPNLWADISAGSGYTALSRDPDFGYKFLERFQDKLLFGTDICYPDQPVPIVDYFKAAATDGHISNAAFEKIGWRNACRLLGLEE